MSNRHHIPQLTLARAIAITCVIIVHAFSEGVAAMMGTSLFWPYHGVNILFSVGTTTFIMLMAWVMFYSYYKRPFSKELVLNFYRKRLLYILVPYVAFSVVYFVLHHYTYFEAYSTRYLLGAFFEDLITGRAHTHLYFVYISVQFFVLFPVMLFFFQRFHAISRYVIPIGILLQWAFVLYNNLIWQNEYPGNLSIWYLSFFLTGAYIGIHYERIVWFFATPFRQLSGKRRGILIGIWLFWVLAAGGHVVAEAINRLEGPVIDSRVITLFWHLYTLPAAVLITRVAFTLFRIGSRRLLYTGMYIGSLSFGLYLLHPLILFFYRQAAVSVDSPMYHLWMIGGFFTAFLVSLAVIALTAKTTKWSWMLFGLIRVDKEQEAVNESKEQEKTS